MGQETLRNHLCSGVSQQFGAFPGSVQKLHTPVEVAPVTYAQAAGFQLIDLCCHVRRADPKCACGIRERTASACNRLRQHTALK